MWMREHRVTADVDPDAVWRRWVDPESWPQDDADTTSAGYDAAAPADAQDAAPSGTPRPGRTGWIKPAKGPVAHFTVVRADRAKGRFDLQTRFPGATMHIEHELRAEGAGTGPVRCELVHRVRFSGPGTPVWSALVGRAIALGLPKVMASTVDHAGGRVHR